MLVMQLQAMGGTGHRGDAIDHGVGEADMPGDPVVQVGVAQGGEGQQCLAGYRAVVRQVIAGHQGEGRDAAGAALGQGRAEEAEDSLWRVRMAQVVLDLRQVAHELAVAVIDAVAALGDGQGHDADLRRGQFVDQRLGVVLGQQHAADGGDHAGLGVVAVPQFIERVEIVLGRQGIAYALVFLAQADAADAPVQAFAEVHQGIGVIGLVGTVKAADADMGDALPGVGRRVLRQRHFRSQVVQVLFVQVHCKVLSSIRRQRVAGGRPLHRRHRIGGSGCCPGAG